jgi:hypothetical protein
MMDLRDGWTFPFRLRHYSRSSRFILVRLLLSPLGGPDPSSGSITAVSSDRRSHRVGRPVSLRNAASKLTRPSSGR